MLNKIKINGFMALTAGMMFFSGCGGSSSSTSSSSASLPAVNAVEAASTAENGVKAVSVLQNSSSAGDVAILSVSEEKSVSFDPVKFTLQQNDIISKINTEMYALNEAISETYACNYGGTMSISGDVTESHFDLTVAYDNCADYDINMIMNGKMRMIANSSDGFYTLTDTAFSFPTDLTLSYSGDSMKIRGGSYIATNYTIYDYYNVSGTTKSSVQMEYGSNIERIDNLEVAFSYDGTTLTYIEDYIGGRIYIDNLSAYLDIIDCPLPFKTVDTTLQEGHLILSGTGGTVDIEVTADNTITSTGSDGNTQTITVY